MGLKPLTFGDTQITELSAPLEYYPDNIGHYFPLLRGFPQVFVLESKDISPIYGRLSLIGFDPAVKISGKDDYFEITLLNARGKPFLTALDSKDFPEVTDFVKTADKISGRIAKKSEFFSEDKRTIQATIADSLRVLLAKFKAREKTFYGLYGAFSYDFVRLFEDLPSIAADQGDSDFVFFVYDSFLLFEHLSKQAKALLFRASAEDAQADFAALEKALASAGEATRDFAISEASFDLGQAEFEGLVQEAKRLAQEGELFEVVFSRTLNARFAGDPFALYLKYRDINPSPYMFYFPLDNSCHSGEAVRGTMASEINGQGDSRLRGNDNASEEVPTFVGTTQGEFLIGASPEMMLRTEDGLVHMRPISGTAPRGKDHIEDHENMLKLLASEKERSELDMLIDLARNDLARISEPGITLTEYRTVERYSRVMHTIAHVQGRLKKDLTALDAYIACANAGTLTGAPKVAAMTEIEKHEKTRRGFYGGGIGYLSFSGEMDTGIIIRTAHIKNGSLKLRAGATLLFDSDPTSEFLETQNKAQAFLDTFTKKK